MSSYYRLEPSQPYPLVRLVGNGCHIVLPCSVLEIPGSMPFAVSFLINGGSHQ